MKVLNFGSLNIDYVYRVNHIVNPGETISAATLEKFPGGKGLNQSIALAQAGALVFHAGLVGGDGKMLTDTLEVRGVCADYVRILPDKPTGNAIIQVDDNGQNSIVLYEGTNGLISTSYIDEVLGDFESGDVLLLQNEISELSYLINQAEKKGMYIVLNPSPYNEKIKKKDLAKVNMIFINEIEGMQITGEQNYPEILRAAKEQFPQMEVVLTVGKDGAYYQNNNRQLYHKSYSVEAVDTTAAGDTFTGYFLEEYLRTGNSEAALGRACAAAAISVTRKGAAESIPSKETVSEFQNL